MRDTIRQVDPFRRRLLDALAQSIVEDGYRNTTVADIVSRARTSRRTFYEHFTGKEECFAALLADVNVAWIQRISSAVDVHAPWTTQVRQAVEAWIAYAESRPAIALCLIGGLPALDTTGHDLLRDMMSNFVTLVQTICGTAEWQAVRGGEPVPRQLATLLVGGLHELIATIVEDGGQAADVTETAIGASIALLGPWPAA